MCKTRQAVAVTCCILRARTPCIGSLRSRLGTAVPSPPRAALSFFFFFRLRRQFSWANVSSTLVPWADFPFLDVLLTVAAAQRAASAPSNRSRSFQGQVRSLIHTAGCPACLRAHPPLSLSFPFVISFTSFSHFIFFRSRYLLVSRDLVSAFFLLFTLCVNFQKMTSSSIRVVTSLA